jgi:protein TonB
MFHYMDKSRHGPSSTRWTTAALSAIGHIVILIAIAVPALYATDTLPTPKETIAFFVSAPPPPPPPPAAPTPAAPAPAPAKVARVTPPKPSPAVARAVAPAPVQAPAEITPETGFEGLAGSSEVAQHAGFEYGVPGGVAGGIVGGVDGAPPPPPPPPPPPVLAPPAPVRVGGEITAPRLVHRVDPVYPPLAQQALVQGVVILEATVDRGGRVNDIRVLRSHSFLEDAAVTAVRQWVYEPLMLNGQPQPFVLTVTVSFSVPTDR